MIPHVPTPFPPMSRIAPRLRRTASFTAVVAVTLLARAAGAQSSRPLLTPADYGQWEQLGPTRLSPDGAWLAVAVNRVNEEHELRLRGGTNDTTYVAAYGTAAAFSADSRWAAYLVGVGPKDRERLTKEKKPIRNAFALRDLRSGTLVTLADVAAFAFSPDARFVALQRYPAEGKRTYEIVVHDLRNGARYLFGNIGEHAWSDVRALLAMTVTPEGGTGGSVQLFDGDIGAARVLESGSGVYRALAWRAKGTDLAVLRTLSDKAFVDTAHAVVAWTGADAVGGAARTFDPSVTRDGLAATLRIAEGRRPLWARDGTTLFLGLQARLDTATAPKKSAEKVSDVEIWHPNDVRVIPQQRAAESSDLRATRLGAWTVGADVVRPLTEDAEESVSVLEGDRHVTETDRTPYPFGQKFGRRDQDVYVVRVADGVRTQALTKIRYYLGADPTGRRLAWFDGKDYWTYEIATGRRTNLTAPLTSARRADFVDRVDDHPSDVLPPVGAVNWTKDGETMLVADVRDLWALTLDGTGGRRLTDGAAEDLRHRFVSFTGFTASATERAIDLSRPVYLELFGRRSKKSGYARLVNGRVERLVLADASLRGLAKADSAERFVYTRQRYDESPNAFVAGADLAAPVARTATNAFQSHYAWGRAELMDFTSTIGRPLQAILYYPANYDPAKKYPMVVYTYELLSQDLHRYIAPREDDYYNTNVFTQRGYFVLMPDIVFRPREPGIATLHAVEPAVRAVIARGLVDPARIGHMGHSQGGYEAAYLATHSRLFATTVMGAGISDMISFAGQMHWGSVPEFDHWETGQFRMEVAPWDDFEAMLANSPLNRIHRMPAKSILIEIGSEDPTVDMRQGVLLYNYARRAGKHAVMLNYPGEGHGLGKKENAIDYHRRIQQWFDHYLKGEPAADWIVNGQTWLARKRVLDANRP